MIGRLLPRNSSRLLMSFRSLSPDARSCRRRSISTRSSLSSGPRTRTEVHHVTEGVDATARAQMTEVAVAEEVAADVVMLLCLLGGVVIIAVVLAAAAATTTTTVTPRGRSTGTA